MAAKIRLWNRAPFLRLFVPFACGIIVEHYVHLPLLYIGLSALSTSIGFIAFNLLPSIFRFRLHPLRGAAVLLFIFLSGIAVYYAHEVRNHNSYFTHTYHPGDNLMVRLVDAPVERENIYRAEAVCIATGKGTQWTSASGKLLLYIRKDSAASLLKEGSEIVFGSPLRTIKNNGNPGAFDFQQQYAARQIYYSVYLRTNSWTITGNHSPSALKCFLTDQRKKVAHVLEKYITGKNQQGIAEALITGDKSLIERNLVQAYQETGVAHIIVIAGLHLGIIYGMILWVFSFIPILNRRSYVRTVLLLVFLWGFALFTGGAPSVLRASLMLSFIVIGKAINRNTSVYNSLAGSAFLLLCYDPNFLWQVSFQLSYAAVLSIVVFYQKIYNLLYVSNKVVDHIWKIVSVTLAAQVLTLPICLYYFQQFPLLFILSNIVAVPLTALILNCELLLVFTSPLSVVSAYVGKIISTLILIMNNWILWISNIPYSVVTNIRSDMSTCVLLYLVIALLAYWLINKSKQALIGSLTCILIMAVHERYIKFVTLNQHKLIVYNVPKTESVELINGDSSWLLMQGQLSDLSIKQMLLRSHQQLYVTPCSHIPQWVKGSWGLIQFYNRNILLVDSTGFAGNADKKMPVDYAVLSNCNGQAIAELSKYYDVKTYIFDASTPLWKIAEWKATCEDLHLPYHSVPEEGAFVQDL